MTEHRRDLAGDFGTVELKVAAPRAVDLPDGRRDPYPSRMDDQPSISGRRDPVVYDSAPRRARDVLSPVRLSDFARDGFLVRPGVFDHAEIAHLLDETERLRDLAEETCDERAIREPDSEVVRSLFAVHEWSDLFGRFVRDERLVRAAEQIVGGPVYVHQSRINLQPAFVGSGFYWHSDFETWHTEDGMPRMRAVSLSLALTPTTATNGPLMIIPGSHKYYVACVGATPQDHFRKSLRRQDIGVPDRDSLTWLAEQGGGIAAPTADPGTVTMFDCNAMHGSNSNITPAPRTSVFIVFNCVENALEAPFAGTAPRPEYVAHRRAEAIDPLH